MGCRPDQLDPHEPENVAKAVAKLGLTHVVIPSVDRDDVDDGGALHFAQTITAIRQASPATTIEILPFELAKVTLSVRPLIDATVLCGLAVFK